MTYDGPSDGMLMAIDGALRSTLFPPIGPAVLQLPAKSQKSCGVVRALSVSAFAGTVVGSKSCEAPLMPDSASEAMQLMVMLLACHTPSGVAHCVNGAVLSMLTNF